MKVPHTLLLGLGLLASGISATPSALDQNGMTPWENLSLEQRRDFAERVVDFWKRTTPSGTYAPSNIPCPAPGSQQSPGLIRNADDKHLNAQEADYIQRHRQARQADWKAWLTNKAKLDGEHGIPGGVENYTNTLSNLPHVGFTLSGGGLRAMLNGVGTLMGFDGRNDTASQRGTGGLLQLADYVAGLSGGSWATGSYIMNDWPTAQQLRDKVWDLSDNMILPKHGKIKFYYDVVEDVKRKRDSGYGTGITDFFGLSIADKTLNSSMYSNKPAVTLTDVRNTNSFKNASYPFPVIIADQRDAGTLQVSLNASLFEFNPFEFGSWNPTVSAFVPIDIVGSSLNNGVSVLPDNQCVGGFDSYAWVVGTSATLFSGLYLQLLSSQKSNPIFDALKSIAASVSKDQKDISTVPNPFHGYGQKSIADLNNITLVDGGLDNQNVPLWPLIEPARQLDMIVAIDASADISNWPNSSALYETSIRAQNPKYRAYAFPVLPDPNTVVNRGLNTRPVFYGCNANDNVSNSETSFNGTKTPIIVYMPSYPYLNLANTSTFKMSYSDHDSQQLLDNAVAVATLNGKDSTWPTCIACAALERGFERSGVRRPDVCTSCLHKWCWDGVTNTTQPSYPYSPPIGTPEFVTSNGTIQREPPFTGGSGENSKQSDADGDVSTQNSAMSQTSSSSFLLLSFSLVLGISLL